MRMSTWSRSRTFSLLVYVFLSFASSISLTEISNDMRTMLPASDVVTFRGRAASRFAEAEVDEQLGSCKLTCGGKHDPKKCVIAPPTQYEPNGGCCPFEGWDGVNHCNGHGKCLVGQVGYESFLEFFSKSSSSKSLDIELSPREIVESFKPEFVQRYVQQAFRKSSSKPRACKLITLSSKGKSKQCKKDETWGCGCSTKNCVQDLSVWTTDGCYGTFKYKGYELSCGVPKEASEELAALSSMPSSTGDATLPGEVEQTFTECSFMNLLGTFCDVGQGGLDPTWDYEKGRTLYHLSKVPRPIKSIVVKTTSAKTIYDCRKACIAEQECVSFDVAMDTPSPKQRTCRLYRANKPRLGTDQVMDGAVDWTYCILHPRIRNKIYGCGKKSTKDCFVPMCQCDEGYTGFGCEIDESLRTVSSKTRAPDLLPNIEPCFGWIDDFAEDDPCRSVENDHVPWPPPEEPPKTPNGNLDESLAYKDHPSIPMWSPESENGDGDESEENDEPSE